VSLRSLNEIVKRTAEVNLTYYKGFLQLATEYVRGLGSVVGTLRSEVPFAPRTTSSTTAASGPAAAPPKNPVPSPARQGEAQLVLEGEPGGVAHGAFKLTNTLGKPVTAVVSATPVVDRSGASVNVPIAVTPAQLRLDPGESRAVVVAAELPTAMAMEEQFSSVLEVPGLSAQGISVVIRRKMVTNAQACPPGPTIQDTPAQDLSLAQQQKKSRGKRKPGLTSSKKPRTAKR
jgi:hypothetical protein